MAGWRLAACKPLRCEQAVDEPGIKVISSHCCGRLNPVFSFLMDAATAETTIDLQKARRVKSTVSHPVDRLPPHSIEAEQGVIGCVLLSPGEAMGSCIEKFKPGSDVFYDLR